jgi:hypothetical protein
MSLTSVERVIQILYFLLEVLSTVPDQKFRFTFTLELPDPGKPKIAPVSRERKNLDRVPYTVCFQELYVLHGGHRRDTQNFLL